MSARKVIAICEQTGERMEFGSVYALAKEIGVTIPAVQQAQERCGVCKGWRIYDAPERIRERIKKLQAQLKIVES